MQFKIMILHKNGPGAPSLSSGTIGDGRKNQRKQKMGIVKGGHPFPLYFLCIRKIRLVGAHPRFSMQFLPYFYP